VATQPVTGVESIEIETVLNAPSQRQLSVAIAAVTLKNRTNLNTWKSNIPATNQWQIDAHFEPPATQVPGSKKWQFPVRWKIGPMATAGTVPIAVDDLTVSCVAVFLP
jgi:hypothetical protein